MQVGLSSPLLLLAFGWPWPCFGTRTTTMALVVILFLFWLETLNFDVAYITVAVTLLVEFFEQPILRKYLAIQLTVIHDRTFV